MSSNLSKVSRESRISRLEVYLLMRKSVEFPADTVQTLATNTHITVENDGKVTTQ
jgi:hypothetical protein